MQNDYRHNEAFCARRPLEGTILYRVDRDRITLKFDHVKHLPPSANIAIYWINGPTRGYNIAYARSDVSGDLQQTSLRMYRGGEVYGRGIELQTYTEDRAVGRLTPCRSMAR